MGRALGLTRSEGAREDLRASTVPGMAVVIALDAGTTGVRALAVDERAHVVATAYRELVQHFPRPGWIEHDPAEIARHVDDCLAEVAASLGNEAVAAVGLTNQRETAVAWDSASGEPLAPAIVWQDRRTAARCRELQEEGHLGPVRARTGLVLDSYFSATKWEWLLGEGAVPLSSDLALGTVDSWVAYRLTGRHVTDPSNASRTLLYDITAGEWSDELSSLFGLSPRLLPEVVPSSGRIGPLLPRVAAGRLSGVPLSGMAGDQQAALFGHGCLAEGDCKVTYGTGSFILMNLGSRLPAPVDGLITTVAWQIGETGERAYALEGAVFSSGATIQWLRDGLGIIAEAAEIEPLALSVASSEGVTIVPAFAGLGSPWWDPEARAAVIGLTGGTGRGALARAAVESICFQVRDVVDAMVSSAGCDLTELRADGGASVMDLLLQLQCDQCQVPVVRAATSEVTALGAAFLAGLAEGVWGAGDLPELTAPAASFEPRRSRSSVDGDHGRWLAALGRVRTT